MDQARKYTHYIASKLMPKYGEYLRINPVLDKTSMKMDDSTNTNLISMIADGKKAWEDNKSNIKKFLEKTSNKFI